MLYKESITWNNISKYNATLEKKNPKYQQNTVFGPGTKHNLLELILFVITKPLWNDFFSSNV